MTGIELEKPEMNSIACLTRKNCVMQLFLFSRISKIFQMPCSSQKSPINLASTPSDYADGIYRVLVQPQGRGFMKVLIGYPIISQPRGRDGWSTTVLFDLMQAPPSYHGSIKVMLTTRIVYHKKKKSVFIGAKEHGCQSLSVKFQLGCLQDLLFVRVQVAMKKLFFI
nr:hypothetical protein Iba_chr11aCG5870 [Ipomoea batatas]